MGPLTPWGVKESSTQIEPAESPPKPGKQAGWSESVRKGEEKGCWSNKETPSGSSDRAQELFNQGERGGKEAWELGITGRKRGERSGTWSSRGASGSLGVAKPWQKSRVSLSSRRKEQQQRLVTGWGRAVKGKGRHKSKQVSLWRKTNRELQVKSVLSIHLCTCRTGGFRRATRWQAGKVGSCSGDERNEEFKTA